MALLIEEKGLTPTLDLPQIPKSVGRDQALFSTFVFPDIHSIMHAR